MIKKSYQMPKSQIQTISGTAIICSSPVSLGVGVGEFGGEGGAPARRGTISYAPHAQGQ